MGSSVRATLDGKTSDALERLVARLGWSRSEVIQAAIQQFEASRPTASRHRVIGTGRFKSGIPDLATNKQHIADLGR
ncbi:MAG: ribbon-helix-helix protein, CopG family [Acidobacteria bacterium]|nr:MAG: ribbon-helix-helix protein, CopG family [Acidobacteriota bacterium]